MRFLLNFGRVVGRALLLLFFLGSCPAALAQAPLLREAVLHLDTARYALSRQVILVEQEPHLYFYYRHDDETAELLVYPTQFAPQRPLRLQRSADFQLLDSLTAVDNAFYRAKIRFRDLAASRFLRLTFTQASDSLGGNFQTQSVNLLPVARTTLAFRPTDTDLYVGEEKVFELSTNNPKNVRVSPDWTQGQDIDYRLSQQNGVLRLHVLPNAPGTRLLTVRAQTERPFLTDNNRRLTYALPPLRQEFTVKSSRLRFLSVDKKEVTLDEAARRRGVEIILDNGRSFELKRTYRIEDQEEQGGPLIAELVTRSYLSNDRVLCWLRLYNTHRQTDSYLYIKDNDQPKYLTNFNVTPKTSLTGVQVRHRGGDWQSNQIVKPGETVDIRLEGEALQKARFHFEDLAVVPSDSSVRSEQAVVYRVQVPLGIDKKRLTIFNADQPTGYALSVQEFQRPHPLDFVSVTFGEAPRPITRLNGPVLYDQPIRDVVFSFNADAIDSEAQLFGKQVLSFEIRTLNSRGELLEMRTLDNVVVCPGASSVRGAFYQDKQCQVGNFSLNSQLSTRKTYDLDEWARIQITVKHAPGQYTEPGFQHKLDLVLQRRVKFDIDVSFPAGLLTRRLGSDAGGYSSFNGISLATLAQFSFYNPNKINKLRPYKVGAGFVALNAFNLSEENKDRDLGIVVLGSVYPTRSDAKLTFPLYLGGGYLLTKQRFFFLLGPGIGIRL